MANEMNLPEGMMEQIQQMQEQALQAQAELAEETVTGTAGGGAVKITITGDQKCRSVEIDPKMLKDTDAEMLAGMVLIALNNALDESRQLALKLLGPLAGGLSK